MALDNVGGGGGGSSDTTDDTQQSASTEDDTQSTTTSTSTSTNVDGDGGYIDPSTGDTTDPSTDSESTTDTDSETSTGGTGTSDTQDGTQGTTSGSDAGGVDVGDRDAPSGTPDAGGVAPAPDGDQSTQSSPEQPSDSEPSGEFRGEQLSATPDTGGIAQAGSDNAVTEPEQGTVSADPTQSTGVDVDPSNFESATEYVETATEQQFSNVDEGEIYATEDGGRAEPRFTRRGAKQAIAGIIGVPVSDVSLDGDAAGGYTFGDIRSEVREQQEALGEYADVRQQMLAEGREGAIIEAANEARDNAERRQQAAQEALARGNYGDPEEIIADELSNRYGFEVTENDVQSVGLDDGRTITFDVAPSVATAAAFQRQANRRDTPGRVDVTRTDDGGFDVSVDGGFTSGEQLESDLDRQLDEQVEAVQPDSKQQNEVADWDWSFGLGGPEDEVESAVDDAADKVQSVGQTIGNEIFKPSGIGGESAGEEILRAAGYPELGEQYESGLRSFGKGIVGGTTAIANVPGLVGGVMEGTEAGAYAARRTAQGEGDEVFEQGVKYAQKFGRAAAKNPGQTTGLLLGSLGASTALFRTASSVSPRVGSAARWSIQPGEEALGTVGYKTTKAVSGAQRADRYFPNKEPLVFSEEAAIRGAKDVARRARSLRESVSGGYELQGSPRQRELIERFRPGTATETTAGEGAPGAVSEPLGSDTDRILDATLGTPTRAEATAETSETTPTEVTADDTPGVTEEMEAIAGEAQGRSELAAAIEDFGVNVREFAADDRAQTNLASIGRSRTETETGSEIQDDRVTANLYQQAVEQQVRADYNSLEAGSGRRSGQPYEARGGRGREVEAERAESERLTERAQRPRVEAKTESDLTRRVESQVAATQEQSAQGTTPQFIQQSGVVPRSDAGLALGLAVNSEFSSDSLVGIESDTASTSALFEAQREQPPEQRQRTDRRDRRQELEAETEQETRSESRIESEPLRLDDNTQRNPRRQSQQRGGSEGDASESLSVGWVNEFVTDFALGAGVTEAPSDDVLAGFEGSLVEQRPTKAMVSGSERQQEQIEAAQDFLFFGGDSDSNGGGLL